MKDLEQMLQRKWPDSLSISGPSTALNAAAIPSYAEVSLTFRRGLIGDNKQDRSCPAITESEQSFLDVLHEAEMEINGEV